MQLLHMKPLLKGTCSDAFAAGCLVLATEHSVDRQTTL